MANYQQQPSYAPSGGAPVWNSQPYAQQYGAPSGPPPAQWQQQQQQGQYPPPNNGAWGQNQGEHEGLNEGYEKPQRFKPKKKWNDLPFLVFFVLTVRTLMRGRSS